MDPFAALADPVRRALLERLARGSARVVDLADDHPISRPAVSRHLKILTQAGLVAAEDSGRERHYRLEPEPLQEVAALLARLSPTPPVPESALDALETEVRRTSRDRRRADPAALPREDTA
ncbi:ArsR/SmtB family transcription factor [Aeromicrobium sp. CTD01-1L150]|uniref:ArsR/SmtB family transcription factor n=1 Tax=Aeromicrobium sp. CTD01-1L150 TaxID=3341830 RepID=UPI0035BFA7EE